MTKQTNLHSIKLLSLAGKPMKRFILALIVAVAFNSSCSSSLESNKKGVDVATNTSAGSNQNTETNLNENKGGNLNAEAQREAEKWWQTAAKKCGDDYYIHGKWIATAQPSKDHPNDWDDREALFQLKDAHFVMEQAKAPIQQADKVRLGLEWWGEVKATGSSHRMHDTATKKWSEWRKGMPRFIMAITKDDLEVLRVRLEKRRGQWQLNHGEPMKNIDCSKLPK
jgi:hypothetical protein